jgi:hypothetical protein
MRIYAKIALSFCFLIGFSGSQLAMEGGLLTIFKNAIKTGTNLPQFAYFLDELKEKAMQKADQSLSFKQQQEYKVSLQSLFLKLSNAKSEGDEQNESLLFNEKQRDEIIKYTDCIKQPAYLEPFMDEFHGWIFDQMTVAQCYEYAVIEPSTMDACN